MKHLTILLLLFSIIFSSKLILAQQNAHNTQQEITELKKEFEKLQLKNEKLENQIQQLKIDNARIVGKTDSFDSNIDSYNNHFGSILSWLGIVITVILGLLALISWQFIFKRIILVENNLKDEIAKIEIDRKKVTEALWNSNRAQYNAHYYGKAYEFSALMAARCMNHFTEINDSNGERFWLKNIDDSVGKIVGGFQHENLKSEIISHLLKVYKAKSNDVANNNNQELAKAIAKKIDVKVGIEYFL